MHAFLLKCLLYQLLTIATGTDLKNAAEHIGDIQGHSIGPERSEDAQITTALYQFIL